MTIDALAKTNKKLNRTIAMLTTNEDDSDGEKTIKVDKPQPPPMEEPGALVTTLDAAAAPSPRPPTTLSLRPTSTLSSGPSSAPSSGLGPPAPPPRPPHRSLRGHSCLPRAPLWIPRLATPPRLPRRAPAR
jgi:hypothetical protein